MDFLDFSKILSYNATLNFIIGERGVGKTYGIKRFSVRDFIHRGHQFVYIRRYRSELDAACSGFFNALMKNDEFSGYSFKIKKAKGIYQFYLNDGKEEKLMGYGMALSTAIISKSSEFPDVTNIIYDEFLIPPGNYHYLKNEVGAFLDLFETIARNRDNVRAFLIGNAVARINPFFVYFGIDEPYNSEFKTYKNGLILVAVLKNLKFREEKKETKFGHIVEGTLYSEYAIDNKWMNENGAFIRKRPEKAYNTFNVVTPNGVLSAWRADQLLFLSTRPGGAAISITFDETIHSENTILVSSSSVFGKILITKYQTGALYFENEKAKAMGVKILENLTLTH